MRIRTHFGLLLIAATASVSTMDGAEAARGVQAGAAASNSRPSGAQGAALTLELLAEDNAKWIGTSPSQVRWSEDSASIYFLWNPEAKDDPELYVIPREGGTPQRVAREQYRAIPPPDAEKNRDATMKVYAAYGDIFVVTTPGQQVRRLTNTEPVERTPHFSFDGKMVTFERDMNLFQVSLDTSDEQQLTNFKTGPNPEQKPKQTEAHKYLEKQQQDLFEYLRETERLERERKEFEKAERGPRPAPHYLKETERVSDLRLSPDGKFVTFLLSDRSAAADAKVVEMPNYVTKSGFTEMRKLSGGGDTGRVKAGEPVLSYRLGVVTLADGRVSWVDHGQGARAVNLNPPVWSEDGRRAMAWAASVDHKDAWLLLLDLPNVTSRVITHERDEAWVRGFRTGRIADGDVMEYGWMPDQNGVYFLSERDGFHHLYAVGLDGGQPRQLTSGKFELSALQMSNDKKTWYFTSNEVHPGESHLYSMPLDGGARTRLTTRTGWYGFTLSPDEQHFALTFSAPVEPTELYVMANASKAPEKKLTSSTKEQFRRYPWQAGEIVTFDDGEGHTIYADVWKPANPHPTRPAIIQVHGSGWAQGVYRRWSNNTPFFNYLAQEGYVVLNLDYRGSRGYGRDFRTAIYRHMGETEIKSAVAATDFLVKNYKVDRRRIGLFGGSYGGFFTLMALFKYPGMFAAEPSARR